MGNSFEERGLIGTDRFRHLDICAEAGIIYVKTKFAIIISTLGGI